MKLDPETALAVRRYARGHGAGVAELVDGVLEAMARCDFPEIREALGVELPVVDPREPEEDAA